MSGRRAALPPRTRATDTAVSGESVRLTLEDAPAYALDLTMFAGSRHLRSDIGAAFLAWSTKTRGLRRLASVLDRVYDLRPFAVWLAQNSVESLAEVTPFHLRRYHAHLVGAYAARTAMARYDVACLLLRHCPTVSATTHHEALKRKKRPVSRPQEPYPEAEFVAIRNAARRCVVQAHARIASCYALALAFERAERRDERARALYEVLRAGQPATPAGFRALDAWLPHSRGSRPTARHHLFLDRHEAFAAAVLLACQRGLNLSPIVTTWVPVAYDGGRVLQLDMDKPRRGPRRRFWPDLVDIDGDETEERGEAVLQLIVEATEAARDHLRRAGTPSQRLLIHWSAHELAPRFDASKGRRKEVPWIPDGLLVDFPRLRRSVPGRGVRKESTHHDANTHLHYVRTDPGALQEQQAAAAQGVRDALDRARQEVHVRMRSNREVPPSHDALVVNCADPQRHPRTAAPCSLGFYSFLDCLDCDNAASVSRLLPRQLAALRVLETLRDAMGSAWEPRFAHHYYMLRAVCERYSPSEHDRAAPHVDEHVPLILSALRLEAPR